MTIRDIYPFWPETHQEIIDRLTYIKPELWDHKPSHVDSGSIRQIVVRMVRNEKLWTEEILMKGRQSELEGTSTMSPGDLISEMVSVRAETEHFLKSRIQESLREVRVAPADPATNEVERNVPISWILWRILEFELISWGQIKMRLTD